MYDPAADIKARREKLEARLARYEELYRPNAPNAEEMLHEMDRIRRQLAWVGKVR